MPSPLPNVSQVQLLKALSVTIFDNLSMAEHVKRLLVHLLSLSMLSGLCIF